MVTVFPTHLIKSDSGSSSEKSFPSRVYQSGLLLLFLLGIIVPVFCIVFGVTRIGSVAVIISVGLVYGLYLIQSNTLLAGLTSAVPILLFFDVQIPIPYYRLGMQPRIHLVDIISLGLLIVILYQHSSSKIKINRALTSNRIFGGLIVFFCLIATTSIISTYRGFPTTGVIFAFNQLTIILVALVAIWSAKNVGVRLLVELLLWGGTLQGIWAVLQSIFGGSFGLIFLGDVKPTSIFDGMPPLDFGFFILGTGLAPGGFAGTSRGLLSMLVILLPISLCIITFESRSRIPAMGCIASTVMLVGLSQSTTGVLTLISVVGLYLGALLGYKYGRPYLTNTRLICSVIAGYLITATSVYIILLTGRISNSAIRVRQYRAAVKTWSNYPIFGVGGGNFPGAFEITGLESLTGVHNIFLAYLAELGLISTGIYVLTIGMGLSALLYWYLNADKIRAISAGSFAISIIGFHIFSSLALMHYSPIRMALLWYVLLLGVTMVDFWPKI